MAQTKKRQISYKQRQRRRQRIRQLKKQGIDPKTVYSEGIWLGLPKK